VQIVDWHIEYLGRLLGYCYELPAGDDYASAEVSSFGVLFLVIVPEHSHSIWLVIEFALVSRHTIGRNGSLRYKVCLVTSFLSVARSVACYFCGVSQSLKFRNR